MEAIYNDDGSHMDAIGYLLSTEANKNWLITGMLEAKNEEGKEIKLDGHRRSAQ